MIKAVLFDYGGVVVDDSSGDQLSDRLGQALGISSKAAWTMISPLWQRFTRGKITEPEIWAALEKQHGQPIPAEKRNIWATWQQMPSFQEMLDFVSELKKDGYKTGLISTTVPITAQDIRSHGSYDLFDPVILSCEVGYAKPDPEIYLIALEQLPGVKPNEVIFLDDRPWCLQPARELGVHTVLVQDPIQAIAETRQLLSS